MAPSGRILSFFFFLALLYSLPAHARESQFFSKVTTNNNEGETFEVPNKEQSLSKREPEPSFIPDTQNGYGLYGHESGQLPPSTTTSEPYTTTHHPYKTESGEPYTNNNNYYPQSQGMRGTRFVDRSYTTRTNNNNYYDGANKYTGGATTNGANKYDTRVVSGGYNGGATSTNNYKSQQEGMSDTRYLENGRYYYDVKNEDNYGKGYENSSKKGYYGNNENSYEYDNSMEEGFKNQDQEFQESGEEEYVP